MRIHRRDFIVVLVLCASAFGNLGNEVLAEEFDFNGITTSLKKAVEDAPLEGACLLVVKDGQTVYEECFGKYKRDTVVSIASASKWLLSKDAIREMEKDQTGGAEQKSATLARLTAGSKYGLGEWLDRKDENGQGIEISSPGAFGFRPWIDRNNDLLGVFVVEIRDRRTKRAMASLGNIQDRVRQVIIGK